MNNLIKQLPYPRSKFLLKNSGFTLAEVLITLGIIGVVAALTIPTLIKNYQKKAATTAAKKAYSTLSQAYLQILKENEDGVSSCATNDSRCLGNLFSPVLKSTNSKLWIPQSEIAEGCWEDKDLDDLRETHYCISTIDGISYDFDMEYSAKGGIVQTKIYVDINGLKKPNRYGKDRFEFLIYNQKILPAKNAPSIREKGYNNANYACENGEKTNSNGTSFGYNYGCAYKYIFEK